MEELLERAGEDRFARTRSPIPVKDWRAAVGPRIADRARPISLERGTLLVKVATSAWANELQLLSTELLTRLKLRGFAVNALRFRVGPLDLNERPPERRATRKVPAPAPLAPELATLVAEVPDDGLRAAIEQAARANLAWQRHLVTREERAAPTSRPQGARGPRAAGTESARPGRSAEDSGGASPRSSGGDGGRRS